MEKINEEKVLTCPKDSFVSMQHIDKIYDNGVQAVFDFNLEVKQHEFIVLVGPSGCGKSTTLRMIAGLEEISNGNLFIDKEYVNDVTPKDRNIAMVFQSYALYPHMSVYDNMAFSLKINKVPAMVYGPEDNEKIKELEKEMNAIYRVFHKYNKKFDKLNILKQQLETSKKNLLTIQDEKKKAKYNKQIIKIQKKSKKYEGITEGFQKYNQLITDKQAEIDQFKASISPLLAIDTEGIKTLEKKLDFATKNGRQTDIIDLNNRLTYLKINKVPVTVLKHLSKNEINKRVHEAARILQIEGYLDRKPKALSGGQRQRVALGRAIVRHAKVFLMDEPLSNLDAKLRVQMRSEIVRLHNQLNATTVYVTHDQTEAMTMATRIVIMKDGHVQQIGTPIEIYNSPANLFVACFIGSPAMNIFKVKYNDGVISFNDGNKIKLPADIIKGKQIPSEVLIGIRPEDIHSSDAKEYSFGGENTPISLTVENAELLGSEYFIHSEFEGKELVLKHEANKMIVDGDKIEVIFNLEKVHFFDPKTEKAI